MYNCLGVFNNMNVQLHSAGVYLHDITGMCIHACMHFHMLQCSHGIRLQKTDMTHLFVNVSHSEC